MFDEIVDGENPSAVFKRLLAGDDSLTNRRLASAFYEMFPDIDSVAMQHIWYWNNSTKNLSVNYVDP